MAGDAPAKRADHGMMSGIVAGDSTRRAATDAAYGLACELAPTIANSAAAIMIFFIGTPHSLVFGQGDFYVL